MLRLRVHKKLLFKPIKLLGGYAIYEIAYLLQCLAAFLANKL